MRLKPLMLAAALALLPPHAQAADPIKIGAMFETSGFLAGLGNQGLLGAQLALEEINKAGGINGRTLEMVHVNTESDETKALIAAKRLIERDKVLALIGAMNSGASFSILDTVQRAEVPLVSNGASRKIVQPVEKKQWAFLVPMTDVLVIGRIIEDLKKKGITKIALMNADTAFGLSAREQWERMAPEAGIKIVTQQTFANNDQDMTPQVTKIRDQDIQALVMWATGPVQAIVFKNIAQLGLKVPVYASHGLSDPNIVKLAGPAADGIKFPSSKTYVAESLPDSDPQKPVVIKFNEAFQKKFGNAPASFAGNGYDSVMILAAAIKSAGTDAKAIRAAIEKTKGHIGVTGIYTYSPQDHYGLEPQSVVMLEIKNGKFELAK
ncbi:ABC transporter substrate-binding protein [Pseudorhodoplanes sp.]|uniref:ABC transporter substrate-binding protein n=1 Tax=Pseudorhodoplanes sp. TaxID=1934341 RepID=UPI003D0D38C3